MGSSTMVLLWQSGAMTVGLSLLALLVAGWQQQRRLAVVMRYARDRLSAGSVVYTENASGISLQVLAEGTGLNSTPVPGRGDRSASPS